MHVTYHNRMPGDCLVLGNCLMIYIATSSSVTTSSIAAAALWTLYSPAGATKLVGKAENGHDRSMLCYAFPILGGSPALSEERHFGGRSGSCTADAGRRGRCASEAPCCNKVQR